MTAVSIAEAKANFSSYIDKAHFAHEEIVVQKHGKPVAVVVDYDEFQKLKAQKAQNDSKLVYQKLNPLEHITQTDYSKYLDDDADCSDAKPFEWVGDSVEYVRELRSKTRGVEKILGI